MELFDKNDYSKKKTITLTLTESCNLKCIYCYEKHKKNCSMSFETAKKILKNEIEKNKDKKTIIIDFFGGEPFLEFELIKQIYEWTKENYHDMGILFFATTNGTLVHGEIKEWLKERRNFVCGLSLDGTKEMHDFNRTNSFDLIDKDFFLKQYSNQAVKMTVSSESLKTLADGVIYCHSLGFNVHCNLAYGIDWSSTENVTILERELKKLIEFYLEHNDIQPCPMLSMFVIPQSNDIPYVKKWCGAGTMMSTYDINGKAYPCQFFMPVSVGEEKAECSNQIKFLDKQPINDLDEKCRTCPAVTGCPTCYGANYCATGDIYKKDENMCKLTKIMMRASAYFQAQLWKRGLLKLDIIEEQMLLRSISYLQKLEY